MGAVCAISSFCESEKDETAEQMLRDTQRRLLNPIASTESFAIEEETHAETLNVQQKTTGSVEQYSIDPKTLELLSRSKVETPIDSGQGLPDWPETDNNMKLCSKQNSFEMCDVEKNVDGIRVKHLKELSQTVDIETLKIELCHKYDGCVTDELETNDESSSFEEGEMLEIQQRKSEVLQKKRRSSLVKSEDDINISLDANDIQDMQQQLKSLEKQTTSPLSNPERPKHYKIVIDSGDIKVDEDKAKANLFRNKSSDKWSDDALDAKKKEIQREIFQQLLESKSRENQ